MRVIFSVAATTFRESIRNRIVLGILLLALGFIVSALLLAELSLDQRVRVITDWGLFCVSIFGVILAILIGVSLVHKEVRRKTLYAILSRPIHRWQYVVGKYLGLALTLLVEVGTMSVALILLLWISGDPPSALLIMALLAILAEILLVAALAVFFASFASPYLSGLFTLGLFVVGRSLETLGTLADQVETTVVHGFLKGLFFALPDFADFNLSTRVVHHVPIGLGEVGWLWLYGIGYMGLLLFFGAWIFTRRDLV
jgi:ABC-type transport system involved in multi-copper enzyme maturation permease subunit